MGVTDAWVRNRAPAGTRRRRVEPLSHDPASLRRLIHDRALPLSSTRYAAARTLTGAIAVATIVGCGLSLTIALLAVRLDLAGYSARAIGLNTAAGGVATLAFAPFIPWAARRIGVTRLLLAALILGGLALVGFTLTTDYTAWLLLRFALGLAVTVMFILSEFWITSAAPEGRRGLAIGIYVTSLGIGFAVGPLILLAIGTVGPMPFYLGGALFVGAAIPLVMNAGGAPVLETRSRKSLLGFLAEAPMATLAALLHGAIEVAGLSLLPVYALRSGLTVADGALFTSLFIIGNSLLQLPLGFLSDRIDGRKLLLALAVLGAIGALSLAVFGIGDRLVFEIALLVWGGIVGAFYPVGLALLGAKYRGSELAGANSAFVMTYALGTLIGPPLIGFGLDLIPAAGFFWTIGGLILAYLIVAALRLPGRPSRPGAPTFS